MSVLTKQAPGAAATSAAPGGKPGRARLKRKNQRSGYLFLLPWFIGMLFTIIPFFASLYLAFTDYNLFTEPNFVGLANFQAMFEDPRLLQALKVTFIYTFVSVPISLAVALLIGLGLERG